MQEAADDLNTLLLADGECVYLSMRLQWQAIVIGNIDYFTCQFSHVLPIGHTERNILRDRHRLEQREMLKHHTNAGFAGGMGVGNLYRAARPENFPFVSFQDTINYFDKRAFAGPIFSQQGMNFTGHNLEINMIIGKTARIGLGDPPQFKLWCYAAIILHAAISDTSFSSPSIVCLNRSSRSSDGPYYVP